MASQSRDDEPQGGKGSTNEPQDGGSQQWAPQTEDTDRFAHRDEDARSESGLSGVTFTGDERSGDTNSRRAVEERSQDSQNGNGPDRVRSSSVYSQGSGSSDGDWTPSVYSQESVPRYQPLEGEVEELQEDVD